MNGQFVTGRALNVITEKMSEHTPLEFLRITGCGMVTFHEIVGLMQSNGYWQAWDSQGRPKP